MNGGLDRTTPGTAVATRRGFDVYKILLPQGKDLDDRVEPGDEFTHQYWARKHRYMNPPTQEMFEDTGSGVRAIRRARR